MLLYGFNITAYELLLIPFTLPRSMVMSILEPYELNESSFAF